MQLLLSSSLIVSALCLLASFGGSDAECCTTMANLKFIITNGHCGDVNAQKTAQGCSVTVCGDGRALVGAFCGRGPCNMFGCNCEGGCLHGNYGQTFLDRNRGLGITLMHSEVVNHGPSASILGAMSSAFLRQIKRL